MILWPNRTSITAAERRLSLLDEQVLAPFAHQLASGMLGFLSGAWLARGLFDLVGGFDDFAVTRYLAYVVLHGGVACAAAVTGLAAWVLLRLALQGRYEPRERAMPLHWLGRGIVHALALFILAWQVSAAGSATLADNAVAVAGYAVIAAAGAAWCFRRSLDYRRLRDIAIETIMLLATGSAAAAAASAVRAILL